ncbi:lachesin-like [Sitodiplosis mosellana]|uniref:lachesin-like n=1 Tax=Sitodiplosis mosellana TaxID=263140 RepID=UPI002443FE51|nr:lachesin-like [Sitodiplosis mosellana]
MKLWYLIGVLPLMLFEAIGESTNTNKNGVIPATNAVAEDPEFTDIIENVTVPAGRNVRMACSVKNLGSFKVAWMHFEQSAILTVHNHVITRNPRISVTHDKHDKHKTWYLHINNVQEEDKGRYMCQINTVTAKTQFGYLSVVVPPNIDDSLSSSDVIVREGSNVSLRCRASGSPTPTVKWKRDSMEKIAINKSLVVSEWDGDTLEISRISRLDMGSYLCIASNNVPPTVSKRIKVSVDFPPMLWIPHQLVGAAEGFSVTLECFSEAHPTSLNYWTKGDGQMIHDSKKYRADSSIGVPSYKTHMKLTIFSVTMDDYGTYKCVAKNPRGETDGTIRLYISNPPTMQPGLGTTPSSNDDFDDDDSEEAITDDNESNIINIVDKSNKYQSNLNEIDKFEHKSSLDEVNKGFGWPTGHIGVNLGITQQPSHSIIHWICALLTILYLHF